MKKLGYALITLGFLAGALVSVLEATTVQWGYFLAAVVWGAIGIALIHMTDKRQNQAEGKLASNIQTLEDSLKRVVDNMNQLNTEKASLNVYDVHHRIDELLPEDLTIFADARESIAHAHSLQVYADVMSHFAAGERYLNRSWSASTDGYVDEVHAYLEKSQEQFREALQMLTGL
ncbi:MAG: hypothetical protein ACE5I1_02465 [bacterium]